MSSHSGIEFPQHQTKVTNKTKFFVTYTPLAPISPVNGGRLQWLF